MGSHGSGNPKIDKDDSVTDETQGDLVFGKSTGDSLAKPLAVDDLGHVQVDVLSNTPGSGATDLGKAIDSVVGATDTGIAILGQHKEDQVHLTTADGDYDVFSMDSLGSMHVNTEAHHIWDDLNATTGWTALGNDTTGLATTTIHAIGTNALTFDKVDGAADTVFGGIEKTITSVDIGDISPHDILQTLVYVSTIADINYVFCRVGTDSSNYNEWRIDGDGLTAGSFDVLAFVIGDTSHTGCTGNGWDPTAVTYIALGVALDAQNDILSGIIFDQFSYHTNQHTTTSITSEVSSSVSSPNVRLNGYGGSTDTNTGNASANTLRTVLATDQPTVEVDGAAADNAAKAGNPVLVGGVYNSAIQTYANGDAADRQVDVAGNLHTSVRRATLSLSTLDVTYDDDPTTVTSASMDARAYRKGLFYTDVTESGAATTIQFELQFSHDDSNWHDFYHGPWVLYRFDDATIASHGTLQICEPFDICGGYIRMIVTCVGTDGSNTFTLANSYFEVID